MRAKQFITESKGTDTSKQDFIKMFEKFLPLAMHYLELDSLPKMEFEGSIGDVEQPTFGRYSVGDRVLEVALNNRHPNDILRTIAHELTHYKQDIVDELGDDSGTTGSPHENEANAMAGIIMRHFNKQYPEYLKMKPIIG
jgi:hypothetical protein